MKVVIVEDEIAASDQIIFLLKRINPDIEIVTVLESVKMAIKYFSKSYDASLIFMDIHLADGISFEIFDHVKINTPIIFTTAYDQYALKAFKVNSIDYLLKPIEEDELKNAIDQFNVSPQKESPINSQMEGLLKLLKITNKSYKATYLVHYKDELIPIKTSDIAYFNIDTGIVKAVTFENKSFIIDKKMEEIESDLNPENFFRVNRQFIIYKEAIKSLSYYFNGKLIIKTNPISNERIVVSKARAGDLKKWLNA